MNLVIDVGNTRIKYALFEADRLIEQGVCVEELRDSIAGREARIDHVLLSASGIVSENLNNSLTSLSNKICYFDTSTAIPLTIDYDTPNSLGLDRVADCVGACSFFADTPDLLVIDVGTAITYNYIDKYTVFRGGNISLGVAMRFKALHEFTANLPEMRVSTHRSIGKSTQEAIVAGVMIGIANEINGIALDFFSISLTGKIIVTGGGFDAISSYLSFDYQYIPFLGLYGLNEILKYQSANPNSHFVRTN